MWAIVPCSKCGDEIAVEVFSPTEPCDGRYCGQDSTGCFIRWATPNNYCTTCNKGPVTWVHFNAEEE